MRSSNTQPRAGRSVHAIGGVLRFTATPRWVWVLSEPLRGRLLHSARTPRHNACSDSCCACCTPLRSRDTRSRRARRWPACVHRPWPSTQRQVGKGRRIPDPERYSAPWAWDRPPVGTPSHIASMPQRIRYMRAGTHPRFRWPWDSPKMTHGLCHSSVAAREPSDCASAHAVIRRAPIRGSRLDQPKALPASVTADFMVSRSSAVLNRTR